MNTRAKKILARRTGGTKRIYQTSRVARRRRRDRYTTNRTTALSAAFTGMFGWGTN
jgi:hypothetical protein